MMASDPLHAEGDERGPWPLWKLLVAAAWPAGVLAAYIGYVLLPLLFGPTR